MFLRTVKMLKATSHAKSETKTSPREPAHRGLSLFLILYSNFIPRSASDTVPESYRMLF